MTLAVNISYEQRLFYLRSGYASHYLGKGFRAFIGDLVARQIENQQCAIQPQALPQGKSYTVCVLDKI